MSVVRNSRRAVAGAAIVSLAAALAVVAPAQASTATAEPLPGPDSRPTADADIAPVPTPGDIPEPRRAARPRAGSGVSVERTADGTAFEIAVSLDPDLGVRGLEAQLSFDAPAVQFGGLRVDDASTQVMVAERAPGLIAVAAYTCQPPGCDGGRVAAPTLPTLTLRFAAGDGAGSTKVMLEAIHLVDATGSLVATPADVVLGPARPTASLPTPSPSRGGPARLGPRAALDVSGDGQVTRADVTETTLAWQRLRATGDPCTIEVTDPDLNGDGCVDIADVQALATSPVVTAAAAPPLLADPAAVMTRNSTGPNFVVDTTSDQADFSLGDGVCNTAAGECSLRAAILESNAMPGANQISFDIAGGGVHTIDLDSKLPTISDETGGLTIDGYTQSGATPNTDPLASNADIRIEINGPGPSEPNVMVITSAHNVIRGLAVYDGVAILLDEDFARQNAIIGNFIGTNAANTFDAAPRWDPKSVGVLALNGARYNFIGSPVLADRNVVSGSGSWGIRVDGGGSDGNIIQNNIVGLEASGAARLPNNGGLDIQWAASYNVVGGLNEGERNVFGGSEYTAIDLSHNATENHVLGNFIGTDLTGTNSPSYTSNKFGIIFKDDPHDNVVAGNVVSNNREHGIFHKHNYTGRNTYIGNWIGLGADASLRGNDLWGVVLRGHDDVFIDNVIADNPSGGIAIRNDNGTGANGDEESRNNRITRNSFFGNGGLAIDLFPVGRTNNDPGDGDTGPNDLLNHPELIAEAAGVVTGTACAGCTVEVYIADPTSPTAVPEGQLYVDQTTADGSGAFSLASGQFGPGRSITALAIDATGNTSEFSPATPVTTSPTLVPPSSIEGDFVYWPNSTLALTPDLGVSNNDGADGTNSAVNFDITVPEDGAYVLQARVLGPTNLSDSFWVSVDGAPGDGFLWDVTRSTTLADDFVSDRFNADPVVLDLDAGAHTVRVALREDGTGIAALGAVPASLLGPGPFPDPLTLPTPPQIGGTDDGRLETLTASVDGSWTPITFAGVFTDPVVTCSVNTANNTAPVVVRARNVTTTGVEVRLQNPGDQVSPVADQVQCLVSDTGVFRLPDGTPYEATTVTVTDPDHIGSWVGTPLPLAQAYTDPVVFGQVMTANDTDWSVFWDRGPSQTSPPDSGNLSVGYEVGDDPDRTRAAETLGVIVFESRHSTIDGVEFETGLSADIAVGPPNVRTHSFVSPFATAPTIGLVTQAAMDGGNGGWAQTPGVAPLSTTGIDLQIDEDQVGDAERNHTHEQVAYAAFAGPVAVDIAGTPAFQPTLLGFDDFDRQLSEGWGTARLGGAWATLISDPDANQFFSVDGEGRVSVAAGANREAVLVSSQHLDFDLTTTFDIDVTPDANADFNLHARWQNTRSYYRARVRLKADGTVRAQLIRVSNNVFTVLDNVKIGGLTAAAGTDYDVRLRVSGSAPTTVTMKVWEAGTPEPPDWAVSAVDSDSRLQQAGGIGTRFQVAGSSANPQTRFSIDDWYVTDVAP